jgi:hypothetical protein
MDKPARTSSQTPGTEWFPGSRTPVEKPTIIMDLPENDEARAALLPPPPPKLPSPQSHYGILTVFIYWLLNICGLLNKVVAMRNNADAIDAARKAAKALGRSKEQQKNSLHKICLCRDYLLLAHFWRMGSRWGSRSNYLTIPEALSLLWENSRDVERLIWMITHTEDRIQKEALILKCVRAMENALSKGRQGLPFSLDDSHFHLVFM